MANAQLWVINNTEPLALTGSANVLKKRFVAPDGSGYPAAGGSALGVALFPGVTGQTIDVVTAGIPVVTAGGTLAVGDYVVSDVNGQAVKASTLTATTPAGSTAVTSTSANPAMTIAGSVPSEHVLGRALTDASSGDDVRVELLF
jgi:hypothetical protein